MIMLWFIIFFHPEPPPSGFTVPSFRITSWTVASDGDRRSCEAVRKMLIQENGSQTACVPVKFPKWMMEPAKPEAVCPMHPTKPCGMTPSKVWAE